jgi:hypothetical protein
MGINIYDNYNSLNLMMLDEITNDNKNYIKVETYINS